MTSPDTNPERPFRILLTHQDKARDGHFRPKAILQVSAALRTSGLLRVVPGEEIKTLLVLLTFLTPNGDIQPTVAQVAQAMHLPIWMAQNRLHRLERFRWQGRPLIHTLARENGLHAVTPAPYLLEFTQEPVWSTPEKPVAAFKAAAREDVIAHSRAAYALPRKEVEREIAEANGWLIDTAPEEPAPVASEDHDMTVLRQRLLKIGIGRVQADDLLSRFGPDLVAQQVAWLPFRNARKPTAYLIAALEKGFGEPLALKQRRLTE